MLKSLFMKDKNDSLRKRAQRYLEDHEDEAEAVAQDPDEIEGLIGKTRRKLKGLDTEKYNLKNFMFQLNTFLRLLKDYSQGNYRKLPWKSLLAIVGSVLYFLNPLDIIPDFIPGIGLLDDVTLLAWAFKSMDSDVQKYLAWEAGEFDDE